jgi:hypothetical protein
MQTLYNGKRKYIIPEIEQIMLDYEISLALESSPPNGPTEACFHNQEYHNNDPFKSTVC